MSYDSRLVTPGPHSMNRRSADVVSVRRSLVSLAVAGSVLLAALYAIAVRTAWGQHLDTAALRGRHVLSAGDIRVAQRLHTTVDLASITLFGAAILLVALIRGRRRLAIGVAAIIVGSTVTTELLKRVLGRPRLAAVDPLKHAATFPSGHTTIAMALCVGAMLVAPLRLRGGIATLGVIFTAMIGCSLVITASHRPSDTIGAMLVVTIWTAAVTAALVRAKPPPAPARPAWARLSPWMAFTGAGLLVAAFFTTVVVAVAIHHGRLDTIDLGRAFAGAASAIVGASTLFTAALLMTLRDVDLDKPARTERGQNPETRKAQRSIAAHA